MSIRDFQLELEQNRANGDRMLAYRALGNIEAKRLAQDAEVMGWDTWPME